MANNLIEPPHFKSVKDLHEKMLGGYVSKKFSPMVFSMDWNPSDAMRMTQINPKRRNKRVESYIIPDEFERVASRIEANKDFSIRMGFLKTGSGNFGKERGDFCLLGASYSKKKLTLHYRSLELFGGLVYDQGIILKFQELTGLPIKKVIYMCGSCHSFALKGNSNQKLLENLKKVKYGHSTLLG